MRYGTCHQLSLLQSASALLLPRKGLPNQALLTLAMFCNVQGCVEQLNYTWRFMYKSEVLLQKKGLFDHSSVVL